MVQPCQGSAPASTHRARQLRRPGPEVRHLPPALHGRTTAAPTAALSPHHHSAHTPSVPLPPAAISAPRPARRLAATAHTYGGGAHPLANRQRDRTGGDLGRVEARGWPRANRGWSRGGPAPPAGSLCGAGSWGRWKPLEAAGCGAAGRTEAYLACGNPQ